MALWGNVDNAANSVPYVLGQLNTPITSNNITKLYQNTTPNIFIQGITVGQFAINTVNTTSSNAAHTGWVLRTTGTGGRSGRVFQEVLVAMNGFVANTGN